MKKDENIPHKSDSLSAIHKALGLPAPQHPLISFISRENSKKDIGLLHDLNVQNFYKISYSTRLSGKVK
ncbi:hypothetical protein [Dyadobacter koreensis]|uniref:hypothetical protein n=1 Tax=Dyadobacter koreensis TaxID=408657 RepID=UPI001E420232|nr:hypothetical protein [Dyadobacter koreensis]